MSIRRVVLRAGIALVVVAAVISGAAAPGGAVPPALTITKTGLPGGVTRGYNVLYTVVVTNGPTTSNHVTVTDPAPANPWPAGTTVLSASTTVGTCPALAAGATSVTCDLGQMRAGQVATLKIKVKTTTDTGVPSFINRVLASLNLNGNDGEPGDVVFATTTTNLIAAGDPNLAQGYFDTGCTPSNPNDPLQFGTNQDVSPENLQSTLVCVPDVGGGTVITVSETPDTNNGAPGFSEISTICVPVAGGEPCSAPATFSTPATFTGKLHPKGLPDKFKLSEMIVYHDGVVVSALCKSDGSLPTGAQVCKFPATQDNKTKIVTQVVKSKSNGSWTYGP